MTYFVRVVQTFKDPQCKAESILKRVAKKLESLVISNDEALSSLEENLNDLVKAVNIRKARGAKIDFGRRHVNNVVLLEAFYANSSVDQTVFCIWVSPVKEVCFSMDVERIIDESVQEEGRPLFDQYIFQKRGGEA